MTNKNAAYRMPLSFLLVVSFANGCSKLPGQPDPADQPKLPSEVVEFAPLYKTYCSGCHGAEGKLGGAPPLNDPLFRALIPESELLKAINDGRRGTPMPAFAKDKGGTLTPKQITVLVSGIQSWGTAAKVENLPPYLPPDSDRGSAAAGKLVFGRACSGCHDADGKGDGMGSFVDPSYLALTSDLALRRLVITGRPDLGMPDFASITGRDKDFQPLISAEIRDLTTWLISHRHSTNGK